MTNDVAVTAEWAHGMATPLPQIKPPELIMSAPGWHVLSLQNYICLWSQELNAFTYQAAFLSDGPFSLCCAAREMSLGLAFMFYAYSPKFDSF